MTATASLDALEALLAKATPGEWEVDSDYDDDALYSSGGGCGRGFRNFFIGTTVDGEWKALLDTQNSDHKLIEEEYDEGSKYAWDDIGLNNARLIVALRNAADDLIAKARRVDALEAALQTAAIRLHHLAGQIDAGFGISGTLRAEQAMKARHMAEEARAALGGSSHDAS